MTHVCSVILIRRSFDIYHEQQKISLHNESILLLEKNLADDFAFCSPDTRRLDIDELTVCHYLQNIRQLPRNLGLHSKDRLLINQSPPMPLVTAIFDSFNDFVAEILRMRCHIPYTLNPLDFVHHLQKIGKICFLMIFAV